MKIKYDYPNYIHLQRGEMLSFGIDDALLARFSGKQGLGIVGKVYAMFEQIKPEQRYYITDSFQDAIEKAMPKLQELFAKNLGSKSFTINFQEPKLFMHKNGFCMHRIVEVDGCKYFQFSIHSKEALVGFGHIDASIDFKGKDHNSHGFLASKAEGSGVDLFFQFWLSYMLLLTFMQECEVERIVVQPDKRIKYDKKKYVNDTRTPLTFLDCRWFRELIIDAPFGVSGHLRWQPCGEGRTKKKLIWIAPYEKKGYHRKPQAEHLNS